MGPNLVEASAVYNLSDVDHFEIDFDMLLASLLSKLFPCCYLFFFCYFFQQSRDYKYHAGSTNSGNPVYYVVEEPDSLHSDRSPYDFEPADTHTSLSSQVADYTQSGYNSQHTNSGDFVIKEHSYTMCPGCPTFSIPVPIPKASLGGLDSKVNYQHARNQTFLEKIGNRIVNGFQNVQRTVLNVFDPILETGGNFLGIQDDQNQIGKVIFI